MYLHTVEPIARIHNDFTEKFGIPRQSNLNNTISTIVFEDKYKDDNSLKGIEKYSHLWLIWIFDRNNSNKKPWYPTVRPPRLGGNKRVGVFSTRSPYHPNRIGMSCVKLISIEKDKHYGTVIKVSGADLLDNTPIIDIKPYLAYTDSHPDAVCGFSDDVSDYELKVEFKNEADVNDEVLLAEIEDLLKQDPRPSYQDDENRVYSMKYAGYDIKFTVKETHLTVLEIKKGSE